MGFGTQNSSASSSSESYLVYRAILSQDGTDAPVASIIENTFNGTLGWFRTGIGNYELRSTLPEFTEGKTLVLITIDNTAFVEAYWASTTIVAVDTQNELGVAIDGKMIVTSIEIKVPK